MPTLGPIARGTEFAFSFLVYREESERWGATWIARSVLTSHLAEALTREDAIDALRRTIAAAVALAVDLGQTPEDWYACQPLDDSRYLAEFCRLVADSPVTRHWPVLDGRRTIGVQIAGARDAA